MTVKKQGVMAQMARLAAACLLVLLAGATGWAQPTVTQTINLQKGWNAVFLEVDPLNSVPATVFNGMPVESVWTFAGRDSTMEFIKNPAEGLWGQPEWKVFVTAADKAQLTNLFAITANRAYLIKTTAPYSWNVTGTPSTRQPRWVADSFNLTGFHLEGASTLDFETFFELSPAHKGQAYYRLGATGVWEFINNPGATSLRQGEAYWIYCVGGSTFQGAITADLGGARQLDFGADLNELQLKIGNLDSTPRTVTVTMLAAANPPALEYKAFNAATSRFDWSPVATIPAVSIPAGGSSVVTLGVRRSAMANGTAEAVLKVSDGSGMRLLIPVTAQK